MEITNLFKTKDSSSKVKCFFSVKTSKLTINGCKLAQGNDGQLYAMMPSTEYTDKTGQKKWQSVVYISDNELRDKITLAARAAYEQTGGPSTSPATAPNSDEIPF